MENKKITAVVLVIIAIALFVLVYLIMSHKLPSISQYAGNNNSQADQIIFPEQACDYSDNSAVTDSAIKMKDLSICGCATDDASKSVCIKAAQDAISYDKALSGNDPSACDKISQPAGAKSCKDVVKSKMDYEKANPHDQPAQK